MIWVGGWERKRHGCRFFNWNADFWDASLRLNSLKLLYKWTDRKGSCLSENSCFLERVNLLDFINYRILVLKSVLFSHFPLFSCVYFAVLHRQPWSKHCGHKLVRPDFALPLYPRSSKKMVQTYFNESRVLRLSHRYFVQFRSKGSYLLGVDFIWINRKKVL